MSRLSLDPEVTAEIDRALAAQAAAASKAPPVEKKKNGCVRLTPMNQDPVEDVEAGDIYFNGQSNRLRLFDGSEWRDIS